MQLSSLVSLCTRYLSSNGMACPLLSVFDSKWEPIWVSCIYYHWKLTQTWHAALNDRDNGTQYESSMLGNKCFRNLVRKFYSQLLMYASWDIPDSISDFEFHMMQCHVHLRQQCPASHTSSLWLNVNGCTFSHSIVLLFNLSIIYN